MAAILNQFGRPVRSVRVPRYPSQRADSHLFKTPRNSGESQYYRPRRYHLNRGNPEPINTAEWSDLVRYSRELFAQLGHLGGAIAQKNRYAVGDSWKPQFRGPKEFQSWGQEAEQWLRDQWYPIADVRGDQFDFVTCLYLDAVAMDVDGDSLMVLTQSANGFPKVAFFSASRIGSRKDGDIDAGPFKGALMTNGIIRSRRGTILGYNLLGETPDDDQQISTQNAQLLFEPEWTDQVRGIPRVGKSLLDWFDVQDIDTFLKRSVKLESTVGLIHYTESGEADSSASYITDNDTGVTETEDVKFNYLEGGELFYAKAGSGEKLEGFKGERPHPNTEAFINRLERRGLYAIGWPIELLDPSKVGGASVRMIQNQARASIRSRQQTIRRRALRAIRYAVAKAMKDGRIARLNGPWWQWDFETPALLTVDEGHEHKADLEDLRAGLMTEAEYYAKRGKWYEDGRSQRRREIERILDDAREISAEYGITTGEAVELLYQRNPNPTLIAGKEEKDAYASIKVEMDSYGVGVRAGALTPTTDDEVYFRDKAGLPSITEEARSAWADENNVRRPITLTPPDGSDPVMINQSTDDSEE